MPENQEDLNKKDTLAFIVGGLFILGLVFATYTYFNKDTTTETDATNKEETPLERLKDMISSSTDREDENANKEDQKDQSVLGTNTTPEWQANDYKQGDIKKGTYTVKAGDTLWEIAEAVYGSGTEWTTILQANTGDIGMLPNGQQALIFPGQVLTLP